MDNYRFILSGGGTGGHIYPAIAIANELKRRYKNADFLFVGAKDKMEMEKVPQAGFHIEGLWISGLQRKLTLRNLMFPIKLLSSLIRARSIVQKFKPHIAIGTGGFASGPLLHMAARAGVPCVLQEQNSFAGITNKILAKKAEAVCVAYDNMERFFPKVMIAKTGNPVRADLVNLKISKAEALEIFGLKEKKPVVLVLGGSLGARRVNQLIKKELPFFNNIGVQLLWQCGKLYYGEYKEHDTDGVKVHQFIQKMDAAYAAADIIISRAGAGSVSELCLVGKPTIFIPSPNVAEDHQTKNAEALVKEKAALMIKETELDIKFEQTFEALLGNTAQQQELSKRISALALPSATEHIVMIIEEVLKGHQMILDIKKRKKQLGSNPFKWRF